MLWSMYGSGYWTGRNRVTAGQVRAAGYEMTGMLVDDKKINKMTNNQQTERHLQ